MAGRQTDNGRSEVVITSARLATEPHRPERLQSRPPQNAQLQTPPSVTQTRNNIFPIIIIIHSLFNSFEMLNFFFFFVFHVDYEFWKIFADKKFFYKESTNL